jgi:hypothetical protein
MNEITELLRDAAPTPSELDLDRVHREGRRRRQRPRRIAGAAAVVLALVAGVAVIVTRDDGSGRSVSVPPATQPEGSTTVAPTTSTPATTTPPPTSTPAATDDRLSSTSRLGYAGLGPITLGMTLAEASQAAGTPIAHHPPGSCNAEGTAYADAVWPPAAGAPFVVFGVSDDRIVTVRVFDPSVYTLSGIRIGSTEADVLSTYPNAQIGRGIYQNRAVRITDAQGREIVFYEDTYDTPGTVGAIVLATSRAAEEVGGC